MLNSLQGLIPAIVFVVAIMFMVFTIVCVISWITQIYRNRKTINAILNYLGYDFPENESMNKLTKERGVEEDD